MRTYFKQGTTLRCVNVETDSVDEARYEVSEWALENEVELDSPVLVVIESSDTPAQ